MAIGIDGRWVFQQCIIDPAQFTSGWTIKAAFGFGGFNVADFCQLGQWHSRSKGPIQKIHIFHQGDSVAGETKSPHSRAH